VKLEYDFEESIGYWMFMASRAWEQCLNEEMAPHGMTYRQWQVLCWLALEGELTQKQLADRLRIEAPTLVGILDRMEKAGWIERRPAPNDRRKNLIIPTLRVQPIWNKVVGVARQVRARATAGITPEDLVAVKRVMDRIQKNLQSQPLLEKAV
jgi:MarR family transcriptional regulator for hemolysin